MEVRKKAVKDPVFKPIVLEVKIESWEELEALRAANQRLVPSDFQDLGQWIEAENGEAGEFGCSGDEASLMLYELLGSIYEVASHEYQD